MLACHGHQQERIGAIDRLEADTDPVPSRLVAWRLMRPARNICIGSDCLQNALTILPDKYASAERPQLWLPLVHGDAPAAAVQRDGSGQPSEPRSGNLCMHR